VPAEVRYTLSEGLHIAFRADGSGPPDLVLCEPSSASFGHLGDFQPWAAFVERLAGFARVVTFDRRGTGLSSRDPHGRAGRRRSRPERSPRHKHSEGAGGRISVRIHRLWRPPPQGSRQLAPLHRARVGNLETDSAL